MMPSVAGAQQFIREKKGSKSRCSANLHFKTKTFRSFLNLCAYQVIIKCDIFEGSVIAPIKNINESR